MTPPDGPRSTTASPWLGDELPRDGRLLGIDFGTRRLGFALSTPEQNLSTPLEVWTRHGPGPDARRLRELVDEYAVRGIVIGLPLHMGGEEGTSAARARGFGRWVRDTVRLPVTFWDERCSSSTADDWLAEGSFSRDQRKARRDMLAAHAILQSYLDRRRAPSPSARPIAPDDPDADDSAAAPPG